MCTVNAIFVPNVKNFISSHLQAAVVMMTVMMVMVTVMMTTMMMMTVTS